MFPNERIENYYRQCEELISFSGLSWWIIDLDDNPDVFYCNQTMCKTFHLDPSITQHSVSKTCPIAGDFNKYIAIKSSENAQKVFVEYSQLRHNQLTEYSNRFPYYDEQLDEVLYFSSRAKALVRNESGEASLLFGVIEKEQINEELYKLASIDSLTQLKNRREFDNQLQFLINLAKRERQYISLILCDIDHFKLYNDNLGHYTGDECLIQIANSLAESCHRDTDIVCRYGGEEFAIITYGEHKNVAHLAENLRKNVSSLNIPHPAKELKNVTISVGYASILPDKDVGPRDLIERADCGLYMAKHQGRNQSVDCRCSEEEIKSFRENTNS